MSVIIGNYRNRVTISLEGGHEVYMYLNDPNYAAYYYPSQLEYVYAITADREFVDELKGTVAEETDDQPLFGWEQAATQKWTIDGAWDPHESFARGGLYQAI
jgi:hypothetical protein